MDPITETPELGVPELWEIYNATADAHPIHVHEVQFQIVDRQPLELDDEQVPVQPFRLDGAARPPEPGETGRKDTVIAYPGEVTRIRVLFDLPGLYVWHCHIVDHEDNEMMRPLHVGAPDASTPVGRLLTERQMIASDDSCPEESEAPISMGHRGHST
jgi:spore coat protein A, manganese oxidase